MGLQGAGGTPAGVQAELLVAGCCHEHSGPLCEGCGAGAGPEPPQWRVCGALAKQVDGPGSVAVSQMGRLASPWFLVFWAGWRAGE